MWSYIVAQIYDDAYVHYASQVDNDLFYESNITLESIVKNTKQTFKFLSVL